MKESIESVLKQICSDPCFFTGVIVNEKVMIESMNECLKEGIDLIERKMESAGGNRKSPTGNQNAAWQIS
jgi:hypothetical protein